jgi:hypothetical protein
MTAPGWPPRRTDVVVGEGPAVQVERDRAGFPGLQACLRERAQFPRGAVALAMAAVLIMRWPGAGNRR